MSQVGLSAHSIAIESCASTIDFDRDKSIEPARYTVKNISGIAASPGFNLDTDFTRRVPRTITISEFAAALGEWTAVAERSDADHSETSEFLVFNDEFGYSPLFYALIPGQKFIVSDSFQGITYELMRNGVNPTLDLNAYITTIITKDSRFSNPLAWQTSAVEIRLLPPHLAVHVAEHSVTIIDRKSLLNSDSSDSTALIDQGIEFVTGTLNRLALNEDHSHSLLLSGGVDSRVVLALVLAAGVDDTFAIRSNDPRLYKNKYSYKVFEDDFFISYAIGKHFGLNWLPPRSTSNLKTSLEEGLWISNTTSSNFSNAYPATAHHTIYATPEISLRGGGGEPIKGAGFLSLAQQVQSYSSKTGVSSEAPFAQFRKWFVDNAIIDSSFGSTANESLSSVQQWLRSESFDDLMPSYYQHCRNRTHFGHAKFSASTNLFSFQPLSNSYFYAASEKYPNPELRSYQIARQIFAATEPSLLDFPFEDPEATELLTNGAGKNIPKDTDILESHFSSVSKQKPTIEEINFSGTTQETIPADKTAALISMSRTIAYEIEEAFPEHRSSLKSVHKSVFEALEKGTLSPSLTVARMMSARDVFNPSSEPGASISYECTKNPSSGLTIRGIRASDALPNLKVPALLAKPPVNLNPKVQIKDNKLTVEANPATSRPASLEFAFYLLEGGKAVQRTSYMNEQSMIFEIPSGGTHSAFSVKCFARHRGAVAPCAITTATT
ncbi:hypothetical protein ACG98H_04740 [Corynebacterium sp. L4756]|uniref:hypothetical protein n=1 Tax=unclassified Corynebacterium TaxID=2624378 RepID=UPI00374DEEC6